MKKNYFIWIISLALTFEFQFASGQICDSLVPVFTVDLSGNPNGTWTSPFVYRDGQCCAAAGADVCVEFIITLDSAANGISFNIISGAIPGGALFYQVNCGPPSALGSPICLTGAGPHYLTFCKPGNNNNEYQIQSIPAPSVNGSEYVSEACTGFMSTYGLDETTVTWTSIPFNPIYNSYLSCISGCDSVTVMPTGAAPSYVDYQVCGSVIGACSTAAFCDTLRINFVNTLDVAITPQNPTICFGGANATVTANPSGGLAPYNYLWSTGATTQSITVGAGTYVVQIMDSMSCSMEYDTVIVNALPSAISANAGSDQLLCSGTMQAVSLNGSITAATGAIWMNGSGVFVPDNNTLTANYTPSASEVTAGMANLMLITTGNSGCPADTDYVQINIAPQPSPVISGLSNVCNLSTQLYSVSNSTPANYTWSVSGGTILDNFGDSIFVNWTTTGSGNISVYASNAAGCDTTIQISVTVSPQPAPVITGSSFLCTPTNGVYYVSNPMNDNIIWNVTGGVIVGSASSDSVMIQWNSAGSGTVSVTSSNSNGCDSTISLSVMLSSTPVTSIAGLQNICGAVQASYTAAPSNAVNFIWSVVGGSIMSNNGTSIEVLWTNIGANSITLTASNSDGCDTTITYPVNIYPQPSPSITGSTMVCTPATTVYQIANPTANNYSWSVLGGSISGSSTADSIVVVWNAAGSGQVSVTEVNNNGCDSSIAMIVNLSATPVTAISGQQDICGQQTVTYVAAPSNAVTFNWTVTGGSILQSNGDSITVSWTSSGAASVTLTAINAQGCDTSIIYPVNLNPLPVPSVNGPLSLCLPASSTYRVSSPGVNNYSWSVTGGSIIGSINADSIVVQWNNFTGTGTVSVTAANSFGCDSTVSYSVNLSVTPSTFITGQQTFCGQQQSVYSSSPSNASVYNWSVSGGNILSNNGDNIIVQWNTTGTGNIILTATNPEGCDTMLSYSVQVYPQPMPVVTGPASVCTPSSVTYSLSPASNNTFSWNVTGGTITGSTGSDSIQVLWNATGTGTVTLTETNSFGCDTTITTSIELIPFPVPDVTGDDIMCQEDTVTYSVADVPGHTYNWSVTGGAIVSFTLSNSIDVYWYNPGNGSVRVHQVSQMGCESSDSEIVVINPPPDPAVTGPITVCLNDQASYLSDQNSGSTYAWSVNGGNLIGSASQPISAIQWATMGQGIITITETDSNGCAASAQLPVVVNPLPNATITGSQVGCVDPYGATYAATNMNNVNYQWTVNGGSIMGGNGQNHASVIWNNVGLNIINLLTLNTVTGCLTTTTMQVMVDSMQQPQITSNNFSGCAPLATTFGSSPSFTDYSYQWSFGDGAVSQGLTGTHTYSIPGSYSITLIASNSSGCRDTVHSQVNVFNSPVADFSVNVSDDFYPTDESSFTLQNTSAGGVQYFWNFGDGNTSTDFEPGYQYAEPGYYQILLLVTNSNGCVDSTQARIEIKVPEEIFIPNGFTPNGDSKNDGFSVTYRNITELTVSIFDRWGEEIFTSNEKDFVWDGTYFGHRVQQGVYVYKIAAKGYHGQRFEKIGTVSVVR